MSDYLLDLVRRGAGLPLQVTIPAVSPSTGIDVADASAAPLKEEVTEAKAAAPQPNATSPATPPPASGAAPAGSAPSTQPVGRTASPTTPVAGAESAPSFSPGSRGDALDANLAPDRPERSHQLAPTRALARPAMVGPEGVTPAEREREATQPVTPVQRERASPPVAQAQRERANPPMAPAQQEHATPQVAPRLSSANAGPTADSSDAPHRNRGHSSGLPAEAARAQSAEPVPSTDMSSSVPPAEARIQDAALPQRPTGPPAPQPAAPAATVHIGRLELRLEPPAIPTPPLAQPAARRDWRRGFSDHPPGQRYRRPRWH
jgi:RND superfamily putative drug exporter